MELHLETNRQGHLIARQHGSSVLRLLFGLPLFAFGLVLAYGTISSPIIALRESGSSGIGPAIISFIVMLIFTAFILPMGWWLMLSRHWLELDTDIGEVRQISDWHLGRSQKRIPLDRFKYVRLALEELNTSSNSRRNSRLVLVQKIRLVTYDPDVHPSIEIGWLDDSQRDKAQPLAEQVAIHLRQPLETVEGNDITFSPSDEQMEKELAEEQDL